MIKISHVRDILPSRSIASGTATTLTMNDVGGVVFFTGTTATTVTLPSAVAAGAGATLAIMALGAAALTLTPVNSETINAGSTDADIDAAYDTKTLVSNGSIWLVLESIISA